MSRDKQIEEMAKVINEMDERNAHYYDEYMQEREAFADANTISEALYNAGYRKAGEVAREIFVDIENTLNQWIELYYNITVSTFDSIEQAKARASESVLRAFRDYIAELKKKYTESEKD